MALRRTLVPVLALALAAGTVACSGSGEKSAAGSNERVSIEMGMAASGTFTAEWWGWLAAQELGYYDELGLDVKFTPTGGSGEVIEQMVAGNIATGNPSMPSVGEGLLANMDLVNIFTYSSGAIFGIFAPADSGIADIAGLKGKKIGISEPGGGEVAFLEAALREQGIDPIGDVKLIPIGEGGPETFQAIKAKRVDAYSTAYNDIFALQTQGLKLNDLTPDKFDTFPARGIITTGRVVERQAEALRRLARGTAMGIHFCFSNLDACEAIMRKRIPEVWEENAEGISQGSLRYELAQKQVRPKDPARYGAHDKEGTVAFLETLASTVKNAPKVDVDKFLNDDFLDYANDFDRKRVETDAKNYKP